MLTLNLKKITVVYSKKYVTCSVGSILNISGRLKIEINQDFLKENLVLYV